MIRKQLHPIRAVSSRTDLSPHVIRVWERRYGAISPSRSPSNRRLYSDEDIDRLILLDRARKSGYSIGQIARLSDDEIRNLVRNHRGTAPFDGPAGDSGTDPDSVREYLERSIAAVKDLDPTTLHNVLTLAAANLSQPALMEQLLVPLMVHIGECWREGTMRVSNEHMAFAIVRTFLGRMNGNLEIPESSPELVVTTPSGQAHELGALIVTATAVSLGWRVTYLGPNLPAEEIAAAVRQRNPRAVALSIVYPPDDPRMEEELRNLRRYLPGHVPLIIGGNAAGSYRNALDEIGADYVSDISKLRNYLEQLRMRRNE